MPVLAHPEGLQACAPASKPLHVDKQQEHMQLEEIACCRLGNKIGTPSLMQAYSSLDQMHRFYAATEVL